MTEESVTTGESVSAADPAAADDAGKDNPEPADDQLEPYNGLPGAFPYAFRATDSLLFKLYVPIGLFVSGAITLVFVFGLITQLAETGSVRGGTFTFSRSFFLFVGLLLVAPLLAPVLSVARRHRRTGSSVAYDRALGLSAFLFIGSIYLALLASAPAELREPSQNPLVILLYDLPPIAGLAPLLLATLLMYLLHRALR